MDIRKLVNDYVECNNFEIKIIDNKVKIYYYDSIDHFSSNKIIIMNNNKKYSVLGKKLVIESMYKEQIVIKGNIKSIVLENEDE